MIVTRDMGTPMADTTMSAPVYVDVRKAPFTLHGFSSPFRRVPEDVAKASSEVIERLSKATAGGRVRFRTTSDFIVVHAEITDPGIGGTSAYVATSSFDIFVKVKGKHYFRGVFNPSQGEGKTYIESRLKYGNTVMKDITIDFPLCANISELYIGLREGSELTAASPYKYADPIVFYGSSIVHGGGLRPCSPYSSMISRRFDTDFINLGFGGGAKAEPAMMEYIASLKMSMLVYDYDHNAPTPEFLKETHYAGYKIFREKQPNTPVIFASKPDYWSGNFTLGMDDVKENERRRRIIFETYCRALGEGDRNVYFVDGSKMFPEYCREDCTVDGCHPTELGYHFMANAFGEIIGELLEKNSKK